MVNARRKSSVRAVRSPRRQIPTLTTRTYAASIVALIGVSSIFIMTLIAPAYSTESPVNDLGTSEENTAAALHASSSNAQKLSSQEIFLHDNALFSQKGISSSSPPTTPILEERSGATKVEAEDAITLLTPPQLPESQQPILDATPTSTAATVDGEEGLLSTALETQFDSTHDDHITGDTFSLGPRASLKLPSSHSPSARAPAHKTSDKDKITFQNDAFVHREDRDIYKTIDNTGIWETAPLRIEPTTATVHAVAGVDAQATNNKAASVSKKAQEKARWVVEDLKKELKATQEMVAALKTELSK
ncbi:hypothetical protein Ndes2437B_g04629 [Nannochloris sp. 'desiccata']